eukprot:TRINITY_DN50846_c0_g1_i1.p1 TRINITY_DN50846_c0_g1~~TRINITY_DN50846_c0_g1_i1.p1  ORF type:complete len:1074 (+),score=147.12 TRINITY_DN50846_c0_g1_i1:14-3235(+)
MCVFHHFSRDMASREAAEEDNRPRPGSCWPLCKRRRTSYQASAAPAATGEQRLRRGHQPEAPSEPALEAHPPSASVQQDLHGAAPKVSTTGRHDPPPNDTMKKKPRRRAESAEPPELSGALSSWVLRCVTQARETLQQAAEGDVGARAQSAGMLSEVLIRVPTLWDEVGPDLLASLRSKDSGGSPSRGSRQAVQAKQSDKASARQRWLVKATVTRLLGSGDGGSRIDDKLSQRTLQTNRPAAASLLKLLGDTEADADCYIAAFRAYRRAAEHARASRDPSLEGDIQNCLDCLKTAVLHRWHFLMLNDEGRNLPFRDAIQDAVSHLSSRAEIREAGGIVALDIGTGTGLLSLVCAQCNTTSAGEPGSSMGAIREIHACELNPVMCHIAREIIAANSARSRKATDGGQTPGELIRLHSLASSDLQLSQRANLLFCEIVDAALVGEFMIPSLIDASQRLLTEDAVVIPAEAVVYGVLLEAPCVDALFGTERWPCGLQGCGMRLVTDSYREGYTCDSLDELDHKKLSTTAELFRIRFSNLAQLHSLLGKQLGAPTLAVTEDGQANCLAVWWELLLDAQGRHCVSSAPGRPNNSWQQALYPLPKQDLTAGISVTVVASLSSRGDRMHYRLESNGVKPSKTHGQQRHEDSSREPCHQEEEITITEAQSLRLASESHWQKVEAALRHTLTSLGVLKAPPSGGRHLWIVDVSTQPVPVASVLALRQILRECGQSGLSNVRCLLRASGDAVPAHVLQRFCETNLPGVGQAAFSLHEHTGPDLVLLAFREMQKLKLDGSAKHKLVVLCEDAVEWNGCLRPEFLDAVCVAHLQRQQSLKSGVQLDLATVPSSLALRLTPFASSEVVRRSRVLWGPGSMPSMGGVARAGSLATVDVRQVNDLAVPFFEDMTEATLTPIRLAEPREVLKLELDAEDFQAVMASLQVPQHVRLSAASSSGSLDGVLCEYSWPASQTGSADSIVGKKPSSTERSAGILWPVCQAGPPPSLEPGDEVEVEVRYAPLRGIVVSASRIHHSLRKPTVSEEEVSDEISSGGADSEACGSEDGEEEDVEDMEPAGSSCEDGSE